MTFINVKDFGAKGDGVTDDTIAIQSVLNVVPSSDGVIYFPAGDYLVSQVGDEGSAQTNIRLGNSNIALIGYGATLKNNGGGRLLTIAKQEATEQTMTNLTAYDIHDINQGTNTVMTVHAAEAGNFTPDDVILIQSRTNVNDTPHQFEFNEVVSQDSTTGIITLRNPIRLWQSDDLDYEVSNVTLLLLNNIRIFGLRFDGGGTGNMNIFANWVRNLYIERVESGHAGTSGITVGNSWNVGIRNGNFHQCAASGINTGGGIDTAWVQGNVAWGNLGAPGRGIFGADEPNGWLHIKDNMVYNNDIGIWLKRAWHSEISDNIVIANGTNINVMSTVRSSIQNNIAISPSDPNGYNLRIFFESSDAGTISDHQNAHLNVTGNQTRGAKAGNGIRLNFDSSQAATTAVYNVLLSGNQAEDGIDIQHAKDLTIGPNIGTVTRGNNERVNEAQTALVATSIWNPSEIAEDAITSTTVMVSGAAIGDAVSVGFNTAGANDILLSAHVQAVDTVRVILLNKTGAILNLPNGTLTVHVWKRSG